MTERLPDDTKLIDLPIAKKSHVYPLWADGIKTLGELRQLAPHEILRIHNMGVKKLASVEPFL